MSSESRLRRIAPVFTLFVLSAVIAELLFGSTYLTIIVSLLPEIGFYGGAAVIIRYVARREHLGWLSILLLGLAFGVFEEFLVVQTSISPVLFPGATFIYGRNFGINWVYFLWAAGYESVWAIVLPIYLTEIVFPKRRKDPWLLKLGLSIVSIIFVLASIISWYVWTHVVAPAAIGYVFSPSLDLVLLAILMIGILAVAALTVSKFPQSKSNARVPPPWIGGLIIFVPSLLWFGLVAFAFDAIPSAPPAVAILAGLLLAAPVLIVIIKWSRSVDWSDIHRVALILGGLASSMIAGYWASGISSPINIAGKTIIDVVAFILLSYLAYRVRRSKILDGARIPTDTKIAKMYSIVSWSGNRK